MRKTERKPLSFSTTMRKEAVEWYKHKDDVDIIPFDIDEFIKKLTSVKKSSQLL